MKKSVCILGGTGFIGKSLIGELTKSGFDKIKVITRHKNRHMDIVNYPNVNLIEADLYNSKNLSDLFQDSYTIINLIGTLNNGKNNNSFKSAHIDVVKNIVKAIKNTSVKRIIQVTAFNADSSMTSSRYLRTKGEAEHILKVQVGTKTKVTVLRPSLIFGKSGGFIEIFSKLLNKFHYVPLACPKAEISPIFVNDVALAITNSINNSDTFDKHFNLCGPNIFTLQQVVEIINKFQKTNCKIIPLSDFMSRMQARILGRLPGKVFTMDNYSALKLKTTKSNIIEFMPEHHLKLFEVWAEENLQSQNFRRKYSEYRKLASR